MRLNLSLWTLIGCFLLNILPLQSNFAQHRCATMEALEEYPATVQEAIEQHLSKIHQTANEKTTEKSSACVTGGEITIPVVVHVLYDPSNIQTNISEAQIESQICQLNADYAGTNQDLIEALDDDGNKDLDPAIIAATTTGTCIRFCLATFDHPQNANLNPDGLQDGQKAIIRRSLAGFSTDFPPTFQNTPGANNDIWEISPIWNSDEYLNLWVVPSIGGGGVLGFAQLPNGPANTDGVVIRAQNVGSSSPDCGPCAGCFLQSNFDWGRTMAHEVGHWLGLLHPWGSANGCNEGQGDGIFDTPNQFASSSQFGCNVSGFPVIGDQCTPSSQGGIMYMNYMDYSADACLILFSNGQQAAMEGVLNNGARSTFGNNDLEETKCTPITDPPIASFTYDPNPVELCNMNGKIQFTDTSEDNPTQWTWTFAVLNGDIAIDILASSNRNPIVEVIGGTSGTIEATLEASNSLGDDTATENVLLFTVSEDFCPSCEGGVNAGEDVTVCPNEDVVLNATTGVIGIGDETTTATIGSTDLTGDVQECIAATSQASIDVTAFTFSVNPSNETLTDIGPGSIKEVCVNLTVTNNNATYISLDHANGSYEDLWVGTGLLGGSNGDGTGTIDVCFTAGTSSGPFDGIFDGDSGGGSFIGQPTVGGWMLYVLDFGCLFENPVTPTINSASLILNDGDGGFSM